ncbi:MAG: dehydrogenase [Bacteroidetes bacterium]|nr:dehydrogenase [Bacteroidota bacterium]
MKRTILFLTFAAFVLGVSAQNQIVIKLNEHCRYRGYNTMEAFQKRRSVNTYETRDLSLQDLSDLLWAANGINRSENGKKTAPSAMNSQDVDIYVSRADGTYLYNAITNDLVLVTTEDLRPLMDGNRPLGTPVILVLISDMSRYKNYSPGNAEQNKHLYEMGAIDAGIVSQNISLFCAANDLGTRPRASMNQDALRKALNLKESQVMWLNHPVGYPK